MSEVDDSQHRTGREAAQGVGFKKWCGWRGSNPRPLASEANLLVANSLYARPNSLITLGKVQKPSENKGN